jgi:hypothetical protein
LRANLEGHPCLLSSGAPDSPVVKAEMSPTRCAGVVDMNKRTQTAATMAAHLRQVALLQADRLQRHNASRLRRRCDVSASIFRQRDLHRLVAERHRPNRRDAACLAREGEENSDKDQKNGKPPPRFNLVAHLRLLARDASPSVHSHLAPGADRTLHPHPLPSRTYKYRATSSTQHLPLSTGYRRAARSVL